MNIIFENRLTFHRHSHLIILLVDIYFIFYLAALSTVADSAVVAFGHYPAFEVEATSAEQAGEVGS
jgi:hypothetical protein